jgi:dipeptidyl aminopeptidase/acylaminoacyl peptidase
VRQAGAVLCAALLACAAAPPAAGTHQDGEIVSLVPAHEDAKGRYFALTYWSDGLRVKGFLGFPKTPGRHAAVVYNRGGNRELGRLEGFHLGPFVEAGYVTAGSQYRGSGGSEGREEFGGADVHDVTNLVKLLQRLPEVDPGRVGMFGLSRGGMMTYLALKADALAGTRTIRAAVTVGGLADLLDDLDERPEMLREVYLPLVGAYPQQDPAAYAARSAVRWPELLRAPLLLLHGEADTRVPVRQARALAAGIERAGGDVKLVVFPGADHGLSAAGWGVPETLAFLAEHLR